MDDTTATTEVRVATPNLWGGAGRGNSVGASSSRAFASYSPTS